MHVAVCIVGFRNPDDIQKCLTALAASTHTDFEVIICENGGATAYGALTAVLPEALPGGQPVRAVLAPRNLGYAGGVNVCLRESPAADAWWVLNPDTEPYPDAMSIQVARLARGDCEAVGCTLHLPDGQVQSHGGRWRPWLARGVSIGHGGSLDDTPDAATIERRQNYLNGASMLVSRRFVESVGPMREDYFLYAEEVEWCLRGRRRRMRLGYAPGALVLHHQGTTTGNVPDVTKKARGPTYLNERNRLLLTRDLFPARLPIVALTAFGVLLARYTRRSAWRQLVYGASGWVAGLLNERGPPALRRAGALPRVHRVTHDHGKTRYFVRDDDIGELTGRLRYFAEVFLSRRIPISLQIIPSQLTAECARFLIDLQLAHPGLVEFGQHGLRHEMMLGDKRLKREFGPERSFQDQIGAIIEGQAILKSLLGSDREIVVFTPPQHKYDRNTVMAAAVAGYRTFSAAFYPTRRHQIAHAIGRNLGISSVRHHGISYHGRRRPEAEIADVSISIAVDDGSDIVHRATDLPRAIADAEMHSDLVGLMFHHKVYDDQFRRSELAAIADALAAIGPSRFHRMAELASAV